jgi:hypothetical protein
VFCLSSLGVAVLIMGIDSTIHLIFSYRGFEFGFLCILAYSIAQGLREYFSLHRVSIDANASLFPGVYPTGRGGYTTSEGMYRGLTVLRYSNLGFDYLLIRLYFRQGVNFESVMGGVALGFIFQLAARWLFSGMVNTLKDPDKLLSLYNKEVPLWGSKPEDWKVKAIGFRTRPTNWKTMLPEIVLWFQEPRVLRWVGLLFPLAMYIVPTSNWRSLRELLKEWRSQLTAICQPVRVRVFPSLLSAA